MSHHRRPNVQYLNSPESDHRPSWKWRLFKLLLILWLGALLGQVRVLTNPMTYLDEPCHKTSSEGTLSK